MTTETTTVGVGVVPQPAAVTVLDPDPEQNRLKWELIHRFGLEKYAYGPRRSLEETMAALGAEAQRNGLTDEILQAILAEPDDADDCG